MTGIPISRTRMEQAKEVDSVHGGVSPIHILPAIAALLVSGCATAIHERPNPSGGAPLTTFWTSSNADVIQFTRRQRGEVQRDPPRQLHRPEGGRSRSGAFWVWAGKWPTSWAILGGQAIDTAQ